MHGIVDPIHVKFSQIILSLCNQFLKHTGGVVELVIEYVDGIM